ncbi:putative transferase [Helianthus anomalus]
MNHMVVDGSSFWHFFNSWSEVFRSKRENNPLNQISRPPVIERWVPEGCDKISSLQWRSLKKKLRGRKALDLKKISTFGSGNRDSIRVGCR